jgi:hypothetical protein
LKARAEADSAALDIIAAVPAKIRKTPAKAFAGVADRARALRFDTSLGCRAIGSPRIKTGQSGS